MTLHLYAIAILMGAVLSIYVPMISQTARIIGAPVMGNVPFFLVAFLSSIVIALAAGQRGESFRRIAEVPLWLHLAGVMSAAVIVGLAFLVPRIGTGPLFVLLVTGQILAGLLINQFGLLGVPAQPMSLTVAAGAVLVIAGAALVTFGAS